MPGYQFQSKKRAPRGPDPGNTRLPRSQWHRRRRCRRFRETPTVQLLKDRLWGLRSPVFGLQSSASKPNQKWVVVWGLGLRLGTLQQFEREKDIGRAIDPAPTPILWPFHCRSVKCSALMMALMDGSHVSDSHLVIYLGPFQINRLRGLLQPSAFDFAIFISHKKFRFVFFLFT